MRNARFCPSCGTALGANTSATGVCPKCAHPFGHVDADPVAGRADTLPFAFSDVYGGFAEAHGLARLEENELVLEFQVKDAILGVIKSGLENVRIALADIAQLRLEQGWISAKVVIRTKSLAALAKVPTSDQGEVTLAVKRADKALARSFVNTVQARLGQSGYG